MKKLKFFVTALLFVCTLSTSTACGTTQGDENMQAIMLAVESGELSSENAAYVREEGDVAERCQATAGGWSITDSEDDLFSGIIFYVYHSEPLEANPEQTRIVRGDLIWYENEKTFSFFGRDTTMDSSNHGMSTIFEIKGLDANAFYKDGEFTEENCEDFSITYKTVMSFSAEAITTAYIMDCLNACFNGLHEIYSAKGYPIKK